MGGPHITTPAAALHCGPLELPRVDMYTMLATPSILFLWNPTNTIYRTIETSRFKSIHGTRLGFSCPQEAHVLL